MEQQRTYESLPVCVDSLLKLFTIGLSLRSPAQTCHCLPITSPMWRYMQILSISQASPLPLCDPSLPHAAPAACFRPQGNPADGAYACMRRPQSPGPCVVWLYVYVCGLPGPLLICPKPANGLPSDHGCLLYFCLHQLNSDRPLPPAGPNQAPAPPPHSP